MDRFENNKKLEKRKHVRWTGVRFRWKKCTGCIENRMERTYLLFLFHARDIPGTFGGWLTFYDGVVGSLFNEDRGRSRWRDFRDSQNPWCALSVHWTSRGVIVVVVIVYHPMYSSMYPRVPLSLCLVRHSLRGSLEEDVNLLTGILLPSIT